MIDVPPEVLLSIFTLLSQQEKLECMTVCRQWNDIILHHCLFRDITLYFKSRIDDFIEMMERDLILGQKVDRLKIEVHFNEEYNAAQLARAFPNLRDFSLLSSNVFDGNDEPVEPLQDHPWCEHLEKMVENTSDFNTRTLLVSGLCKNLTHIATCSLVHLETAEFIKSLANTPALRTLELEGYDFYFTDFELLHDLVPLLDSLSLKNAHFIMSDLPEEIKPLTSLRSFKCTDMDFFHAEDFNLHLVYIIQKYTRLEEFAVDVDAFGYGEDEYTLLSIRRAATMLRLHFKALGSQLKTLSLKVNGRNRTFPEHFDLDVLDDCKCQIEHLELGIKLDYRTFEQLAKTNQVQYLQSLTINDMAKGPDGLFSWRWLKSLTTLKELALCFRYREEEKGRTSLSLVDLLDNLSETQLETLRLENVQLEYDESSDCDKIASLKNLSFLCVSFQEKIDSVITIVFPNLKHLKLYHCFKEKVRFCLPLTDLSYLEITGVYSDDDFDFMVFTNCNKQARLYNTAFYSSQPFGPYDDVPDVVFACNSLYTFIHE